ncbi:MAG: tetratricopeptide repeat protein [Planctomycetota bacterium]|jgi:superkiller protein 3
MKKHKKIGKRKTKDSERSKSSASSAPKFAKWPFISGVIVCVVIAGFWGIRSFVYSDDKTPKKQSSPILTEKPEASTVPSKLTPQQEIAALRKEELEFIELLIKEFPDSEVPLVLMGNLYRRQGNSVEAVKCWEKALVQNPKRPDAYEGMGWIAIEKGEYENAIAFWRKALEVNPKMPGVHNSIAQALMSLGKYNETIEEAQKELKISPRSGLGYFLLGQGYLKQKEFEKAKENYEVAIALQPNHTNAYYGLFTVYSRLKLQDKAKEYMATFKQLKTEDTKKLAMDRNKALDNPVTIKKDLAETYSNAGQLYRKKGDLQKAEELLVRAITLSPQNTEYLMKLASLFQRRNRLPDALQMYEKVRKMDPDNMINHMNIGVLSMQLKKFTDAEKAFQTAITLAPGFSSGYRELAQLYLKTGTRFSEAMKLAEKAVALEEIAANYFILSWAYDRNGDVTGARLALKRATELDPDNLEYQRMYKLIQKRNSRGDS